MSKITGSSQYMNNGLFTSNKDNWETPQELFNKLNRIFSFELDVAADENNHKCDLYFSKEQNGLSQEWKSRNWMNPPYGRDIINWIRKANEEAKKGKLTVALLPARTDTKWYHDYCVMWHKVFLRGRLHFSGGGECSFSEYDYIFRN